MSWSQVGGGGNAPTVIGDVLVHTWDLARGTGQSPAWDESVLQVADAAIHAQLPEADRSEMWAAVAAQLPAGQDGFATSFPVPASRAADSAVASSCL